MDAVRQGDDGMKRRTGVYISMFLSYVGILLIPILAGAVIYWFALEVTRNQTDKMNDTLLSMVQRELDYKVEEIGQVISSVAMNSKAAEAAGVEGRFGGDQQFLLYSLVQELKNINLSERYVNDVFVYFHNTQMISSIRGNMAIELYYQLYYENRVMPLGDFKNYLQDFHYSDTLNITNEDGEQVLIFTMSDLNASMGGVRTFTVGATMNLAALRQTMEAMLWDEDMMLLIINHEDQVICETGAVPKELKLEYDDLMAGSQVDHTLLEEPYTVLVRESEKSKWKYVMLIPQALMEQNAKDIRQYAVLGLFACIIVGFMGSYFMAKKNYYPLKGILDLFAGHRGQLPTRGENEYQWLKHQTEQFFQEHMDNQVLLIDSYKNLKLYHLLKLLEFPYEESMKKTLESYHIQIGEGWNIAVLFSVDHHHEYKGDASVSEQALRKFILKNVFEELILDYYHVETIEVGERLAVIIGVPDGGEIHREKIKELIETMQQLLEEKFQFTPIALVGDVHEGLQGIHPSYGEACELGEYVELLNTDLIIYSDVKNVQKKYNYSMETEQKIINAIRIGNAPLAMEYINQAFDDNIDDRISIDVCRCLIYDMMGTLLKGADEGGYFNFSEGDSFSKELSARLPLGEIKKRFEIIVEDICGRILKLQEEAEEDNKLSRRIQEYIGANYQDADLNISMVGQHFEITPAYLSTVYKKQTGESLLDYINKVRLEQAERYLQENYSVTEVAQMSGFRDSGSFIRVFKKKMGITPGQLKKKI